MREKPGVVRKSNSEASDEEVRQKRIDLSVPQVAGSAVAAVLAAELASSFGVYGTIAGAGVVGVIATCGGSLFQHFFKRTGEQLRTGRTPVRVAVGAAPQAPPAAGEFSEGTVHRARARLEALGPGGGRGLRHHHDRHHGVRTGVRGQLQRPGRDDGRRRPDAAGHVVHRLRLRLRLGLGRFRFRGVGGRGEDRRSRWGHALRLTVPGSRRTG
ncbi:hypothetical protein ABT033_27430 [Streptomyces pharetrae]|uniref:hypothetical protein n=1 Tax=Streptomyces pharetrae TaxID=291370 RepID=UPI00335662A9